MSRSRSTGSALCLIVLLVTLNTCLVAGASSASDVRPGAEAAAETTTTDRPSVGLVLGGGGARGAAHIGVLRVLEELRIPIDHVCGTSMGAVVAALFSLGLSPDEIEDSLLAVDWDDLFSDAPDRSQRSFRRKEDQDAFFLPVEFGFVGGRVVTSRGLIAGQKLSFAFPIPELYSAGYKGFDNLAYPFRALATDLHTGDMVVLDRGNLVQAVRASMSIPGLFPPVYWQGRELIDGGIVRNLPVDVARDMGADFVIAVDVGELPEDRSEAELGGFVDVLMQTVTIQGRTNVEGQMQAADIAIQVKLDDISIMDFARVGETIPLGEKAARAEVEALAALTLSPELYAAHLAAHRLPSRKHPVIDRIFVRNATPTDDTVVRRHIGQPVGQALDLDRLKQDLARVHDLGVAELVDFAVVEADSQTVLTVMAWPKRYAPGVLRLGLSYSGGQKNKSTVSTRLRYTWLELNALGGEWRNDGQYGRVVGIRTEYYQPLTWSRVPFLSVGGWWRRGNYDGYEDLEDLGNYDVDELRGDIAVGSRLSHWGELRLGLWHNEVDATATAGGFPEPFDGTIAGYHARLSWDVMDRSVFPRSGVAGYIDYLTAQAGLGSDLEYEKMEVEATAAVSTGASTFRLGFSGGTDFASGLPEFDVFAAGGLGRLSGFRDRQLRGRAYGIGSLAWYHRIYKSPSLFPTSWFVGLGLDAGNTWRNQGDAGWDDLRYGINVSLMVDTYLGPATLAYGREENGNDAVYLIVGSPFGIFR